QPGARPPRRRVEAGLARLRPALAIAGERGVDQALVQMLQILVADAEPAARRGRVVGDEDIGLADEAAEHLAAFLGAQIERQAPLVARVEKEARAARPLRVRHRAPPIWVAHPRRRAVPNPE